MAELDYEKELTAFVEKVKAMRNVQKRYFMMRTGELLGLAREAERMIDVELRRYDHYLGPQTMLDFEERRD